MEKINLEKLFNNNFDCHTIEVINWKQVEVSALTKDKFKELCVNLSKQLLALAAENAYIEVDTKNEGDTYITIITGDSCETYIKLNKESILDTIKQLE